jgi:uncharacterized protein (TIGR03437 family)
MAVIPAVCIAQNPPVDYRVVTIQELTSNGGRVGWSPSGNNLIAFDRENSVGYFDVWTMNPDPANTNEICLTCNNSAAPPYNKGNPDWHPSGNYIVSQAQRPDMTYSSDPTASDNTLARPGIGINNVIYIMDAAGENYWEVAASENPAPGGVLHPHFSHDGTKLIWAQQIARAPSPSGEWVIQVASFTPGASGGAPTVQLLNTLQPGVIPALLETHGFSRDDTTIFFSGTASGQPQYGNDIYSYNLNTGAFADLTNTPDNWDEHSRPSPVEDKLIFISTYGNLNSSIGDLQQDYWTMNYDGSDKKRVTWFVDPDSPNYLPGMTTGDNDWSPDGTQSVVYLIYTGGGATLGQTGADYLLTYGPSATVASSASYFNFPQAPGSIVSSFGSNLAGNTAGAAATLTTSLGETSVTVTDSQGTARPALLAFASSGQGNWIVPTGTAPGPATVAFDAPSGTVLDTIGVENVSPAIYTILSNGSGPAAGFINVYPSSGPSTSQPIFNCSPTCTTVPVSISGGSAYLVLFATGIENHQKAVTATIGPSAVTYWAGQEVVSAGSKTVTASFAGAQGQFTGLDQVNIPIPASFAGAGSLYVQLHADGFNSNVVQIQLQ